jgi:hypothetical protein
MMAIGRRRQLVLTGMRIWAGEFRRDHREGGGSFSIDRVYPLEDVISIARWAISEIP